MLRPYYATPQPAILNLKSKIPNPKSISPFRDEICRGIGDVCHYDPARPLIKIFTMLKRDALILPVFQGLTDTQLDLLAPLFELRSFKPDMVIFQQGQMAAQLYVLRTGEVEVRYKPYDGPELTVARILPGGVFGWSTALGRPVYTSAAVAVQPSQAWCICSNQMNALCQQSPETGRALLEHLAGGVTDRLRGTHTQIMGLLTRNMDRSGDCRRSEPDERKP